MYYVRRLGNFLLAMQRVTTGYRVARPARFCTIVGKEHKTEKELMLRRSVGIDQLEFEKTVTREGMRIRSVKIAHKSDQSTSGCLFMMMMEGP